MAFALALFLAVPSFAVYQFPDQFKGEIQDKAERRLLYNYARTVTRGDNKVVVKREFSGMDGALAATETVTYDNGKVAKMELDHKQTGELGFFEIKGDKIYFTLTKDGKTKQDDEIFEGNTVSTDETFPFIQKNWDLLMKGETLNIRFPVISRLETVGFKFFKDREDDKYVYIKMKPSSFVIAALVKPLTFKIEKDGERRLMEVDGRVTPKRREGNSWKDLDAIFVMKY